MELKAPGAAAGWRLSDWPAAAGCGLAQEKKGGDNMNLDLETLLKERIVMLDGAMGTLLQRNGMPPGACPELFSVENPALLEDLHRQYVEAGSDIIQTITFGANRFKLGEYGLAGRTAEINAELVRIARQAAGRHALVAVSVGPTGQLLEPMGTAGFDDLFNAFKEQMEAAEKAGADIISIETMIDIGEMRAALVAARSCTRLPVLAHMTFEGGARTMTGSDPRAALIVIEAFQPLAIGANCSGGARELLPVIAEMARYTVRPLSVEPNAGLPRLVDGETVFPDSPGDMAAYALQLREAGASIIGGCCGTTPDHIAAMAGALKSFKTPARQVRRYFAFASRSRSLLIGEDFPLAFIGERINPTARKKLAEAIRNGQMQEVAVEARLQAEAGAGLLDVNMGVPGIDEAAAMGAAVKAIQAAIDMPLAIDSTNPEAVEAGLKAFAGRPLINSTTGEDRSLEQILPLAKKYGAAVLGLCLDDRGIPDRAEGRVAIARKIFWKAREAGLREEDIFIDCLVKTASAEQAYVMEALQALRAVKEQLGSGTVLGISNVSHGLPARDQLNAAYLAMAWAAGLDLPIINPFDEKMIATTRAAAVLMNRDRNAREYIEAYHRQSPAPAAMELRHPLCRACNIPDLLRGPTGALPGGTARSEMPGGGDPLSANGPGPAANAGPAAANTPGTAGEASGAATRSGIRRELFEAVLQGNRDGMEELLGRALEDERIAPLELVNEALIPGIEQVGEKYERQEYFLPQLIMAGDAMKKAFEVLKPLLSEDASTQAGTVVLATVEGDIHDIGKNIVAVMMENYGFRVIDLGKDVPAKKILDEAEKHQADIIGLSALMTTTMPRMAEVIRGAGERGLSSLFMVGGAVLTQEYADQIGAYYARDARDAVQVARRILENPGRHYDA